MQRTLRTMALLTLPLAAGAGGCGKPPTAARPSSAVQVLIDAPSGADHDAQPVAAPDDTAPLAPTASSAPADGAATGQEAPPPAAFEGPPADATTTASGLSYRVLAPGDGGRKPGRDDTVLVAYAGYTTDGKRFDSTAERGPMHFRPSHLIKGLAEGLTLMSIGARYRFWIPSPLAYGDSALPGRPQGMLIFDVELLEIQ